MPVNPNSLLQNNSNASSPRLKLLVTMASGFFHEELIRHLIALCGMHVDVEQSSNLDFIDMCIEGDFDREDASQIASLMIPNLEDLVIDFSGWEGGPNGVIQLITLIHISDLLHRNCELSYA